MSDRESSHAGGSGSDEVEFWIPLVDEPIGSIIDEIAVADPEIAELVDSPRVILAFKTFAYIRVGLLLGELLVENEVPEARALGKLGRGAPARASPPSGGRRRRPRRGRAGGARGRGRAGLDRPRRAGAGAVPRVRPPPARLRRAPAREATMRRVLLRADRDRARAGGCRRRRRRRRPDGLRSRRRRRRERVGGPDLDPARIGTRRRSSSARLLPPRARPGRASRTRATAR